MTDEVKFQIGYLKYGSTKGLKGAFASQQTHLRDVEYHLLYGILQCYLPPDRYLETK